MGERIIKLVIGFQDGRSAVYEAPAFGGLCMSWSNVERAPIEAIAVYGWDFEEEENSVKQISDT